MDEVSWNSWIERSQIEWLKLERPRNLSWKSDWNKSSPSSLPSYPSSFDYSLRPPFPPFSHDISHYLKILGIAIASCVKEVKFAYSDLVLLFHPDKCKSSKSFTKEKESEKFKCVYSAY